MKVQGIKRGIATLFYVLGLIKVVSWIRVRVFKKPRIVVLCYHRIIERGGLISPQCISAEMFEEQVGYFSKHVEIISLKALSSLLTNTQKITKDTIVFTFDDGYEDNYQYAAPILEKFDIKGCFFVASDPVLEGKVYWIDQLSILLEGLSQQKQISFQDLEGRFRSKIECFLNSSTVEQQYAAKAVFCYLNEQPVELRDRFIQDLMSLVEFSPPPPNVMSTQQLKQLANRGHIIGAHTRTHPRLSLLSGEDVEHEVIKGIDALREQVDNVEFFAYPFGKREDLPKDLDALFFVFKKHQITLAVTTEDAVVDLKGSPFLVQRKVMSAQSLAQVCLKLEMLKWSPNQKSA